jgi:hypothetical protein
MAENFISSALSSIKWYSPTQDNFNKMNDKVEKTDEKAEKENEAMKNKISAGIAGIGTGVPIIAPSNWAGVCVFSFKSEEVSAPNELKDAINTHPNIKNIAQDFDNVGIAAMMGFQHACFFYVDTDRQYIGGSIGGVSLLGSDPQHTFLSAVMSMEDYKYTRNENVTPANNIDPHIDLEGSHILAMIGGQDLMAGFEYVKNDLSVDDIKTKGVEEFKARIEIMDLERVLHLKDTDFSLGVGFSASNKQEYTAHLDAGNLKLNFKWDKNGNFRLEPFVQGGISF